MGATKLEKNKNLLLYIHRLLLGSFCLGRVEARADLIRTGYDSYPRQCTFNDYVFSGWPVDIWLQILHKYFYIYYVTLVFSTNK